jgi:hypothetical protein
MDDEDDGNEVDRRFGNELSPSCIRGMGIFLGLVLIGAGLVETAERRVCHPRYYLRIGFSLYCRTPYKPYYNSLKQTQVPLRASRGNPGDPTPNDQACTYRR